MILSKAAAPLPVRFNAGLPKERKKEKKKERSASTTARCGLQAARRAVLTQSGLRGRGGRCAGRQALYNLSDVPGGAAEGCG